MTENMREYHAESLELAEQWLSELEAIDGRAHRTVMRYRWSLLGSPTSRGAVPLLGFAGPRPVWELGLDDIKAWYLWPVRDPQHGERPPSASAQKNKRAAVNMFFGWLQSEHDKAIDPKVLRYNPKHLRVTKHEVRAQPKPIPEASWYRLWRDNDLVLDDRYWLGLCYLFSFRIGEVANLRPEDVDLEARSMTFIRKGGQYATVRYGELIDYDWARLPNIGPFDQWETFFTKLVHERTQDGLVFLSPQTVGEQFLDPQSGEFAWRPRMADITYYNKRLERLAKRVGVPRFTPHQLRHSCATNLWRAGVSRPRIMQIMNHGKYDTTLGYQESFGGVYDRERERNRHEAPSEAGDDD
jgi:integrase